MVAGKGGVGKTTVAASTALAAAKKGYRTLVLSFDLAHSLSDSFDLSEELFNDHRGQPVTVAPGLDLQEIDVQEELQREWQDLFRLSARLMMGGGVDEMVADEVAILPGMDDVVALMKLNQYIANKTYDVIVLDSPPTGEALRFVSITSTLDWYVRKRLKLDRKVANAVRPLSGFIGSGGLMIPDDSYFAALLKMFTALEGVDQLLRDPTVTTVRLVANPEKMVVRETQRAFMYFCLYGMTIDSVVVNRLLPADDAFFKDWAQSQKEFCAAIADYFQPVPVSLLPMFQREVVGLAQLETVGERLFGGADPTRTGVTQPAYGFARVSDREYVLRLQLPFVPKDQIDISRRREDLVVRIGTFKRNILMPRKLVSWQTGEARVADNQLAISFVRSGTDVPDDHAREEPS